MKSDVYTQFEAKPITRDNIYLSGMVWIAGSTEPDYLSHNRLMGHFTTLFVVLAQVYRSFYMWP